MVAREKTVDEAWDVNVLFFDVGNGTITETRKLYSDEKPPTLVMRFPEGSKERLVLPHRVYEVEAQ
jgi:hypothetical protein